MKKNYIKPELDIEKLNMDNIMTTSGTGNSTNADVEWWGNEDEKK